MLINNPALGSKWYNNGVVNIRLLEGQQIPEGFKLGRYKRSKLQRAVHICPICGKEGKGPNMKRYHFNNCKEVKSEF